MTDRNQPQSQPQPQPQPTEFEKAAKDLGRILAVYWAWKSEGLLDK